MYIDFVYFERRNNNGIAFIVPLMAFPLLPDNERPYPRAANDDQFSRLIECPKVSAGHDITAENCTDNHQVT
ncbi:hypothetical protein SEEH0208_06890 [Salmonella enterica subsp. enterica serovar Heidelberg str. 87-0208]|nr:hypothetical protein SEEH0208_06890 [Salmonella enterica subsp. enterica serovar Heidelberg str. 87-0208]